MSWRTVIWNSLICGVALGSAFAIATARDADPTPQIGLAPVDSLQLPPGVVTGLTWLGGNTLAVLSEVNDASSTSGGSRVLLTYLDRSGGVLRREDFTGTLARGLAYDGEFLWSCGDDSEGDSFIYAIQPDTCRVVDAYPLPGHAPAALCFDGDDVWISDRDSGRVNRLDRETGKVTRSVLTPGFSPFGLAWDGRYMWVTDSGTGRLYRLVGPRRVWNATVDSESFMYRGVDVLLLHDGRSMWYLPRGETTAVQVEFF